MSSLFILGGGGHGKVVMDAASVSGQWQNIAVADDRFPALQSVAGHAVIGSFADVKKFHHTYPAAVAAIGDNDQRLALTRQLAAWGFDRATLIHPTASVSPSACIGAGTVILAAAVVQVEARLGNGVIINTAASVDHECVLADGVHLSPGARLGGGVRVGEASWVGMGASVINGISIGRKVIVGAGAVVTEDIADGLTVAGAPARALRP